MTTSLDEFAALMHDFKVPVAPEPFALNTLKRDVIPVYKNTNCLITGTDVMGCACVFIPIIVENRAAEKVYAASRTQFIVFQYSLDNANVFMTSGLPPSISDSAFLDQHRFNFSLIRNLLEGKRLQFPSRLDSNESIDVYISDSALIDAGIPIAMVENIDNAMLVSETNKEKLTNAETVIHNTPSIFDSLLSMGRQIEHASTLIENYRASPASDKDNSLQSLETCLVQMKKDWMDTVESWKHFATRVTNQENVLAAQGQKLAELQKLIKDATEEAPQTPKLH